MSDIDILPVWRARAIDDHAMAKPQARMVDWWAASGRARTLDLGWLRFDDEEVNRTTTQDSEFAAK
jgi:hypothetical protein